MWRSCVLRGKTKLTSTLMLDKGLVLNPNKVLYGLMQFPREWNETLGTFLREEQKMIRLKMEPCIYKHWGVHRRKPLRY